MYYILFLCKTLFFGMMLLIFRKILTSYFDLVLYEALGVEMN